MKKVIFIFIFLFSFSPVFAQEVSNNIQNLLSSSGKILYGEEPNSLVVIDHPDNVQRVADYLNVVDVLPLQVLIEARVVEVKLQKEHSLGINWETFADKGYLNVGRFKVGTSSSLNTAPGPMDQAIPYKPTFYPPIQTLIGQENPFTLAIFDDNISLVLRTLANQLDTDILSAPQITTVNNRQAEIKIIQNYPWAEPEQSTGDSGVTITTWKIHYEEIGILLKVTPTISDDGRISMELQPEVSEKVSDMELVTGSGSSAVTYKVPIIDKRTASTKVVIGNGQTLIIGGLIKEKTTSGETKIPFLGDIPYFGYLFKSKKETKDKTELLIFVSPTIISPNEFVRVSNQEKYGLGRKYMKEKEQQEKAIAKIESEEETRKNTVASKLDLLTKKYNELVEERQQLEQNIVQEQKELSTLEGKDKTAVKKED